MTTNTLAVKTLMTENESIVATIPTTMPVLSGSLESYIHSVREIPVLEKSVERELAVDLTENNNLQAASKLIMHNLRFVIKVARGYGGYGLPLADLIQEGNVGLMKAVKRFDPSVNVRLVSFAVHWIRAEIHEYILKNWKIVKVATTKAQRKLFFNLRSKKKRLAWMNDAEVNDIATDLGVTSKDVLEMEKRMSGQDIGFDLGPGQEDDEKAYSPSQYLESETIDPSEEAEATDWDNHTKSLFNKALLTLDDRSKDILASRWLVEKKATLQDLAAKYEVSAERIRQIENNAITKMKAANTINAMTAKQKNTDKTLPNRDGPDFESAMADLDMLVSKMEEGDLPLEVSLKEFEKGIALSRHCQQALNDAEQRVKILLDDQEEDFQTESE
ncbi:RNA polymerase sigma factor RpoH [Nymphon striatum]|nr:RNA polymerase sigma factor RpoH [Nymphon striatum]